MGLKTYKTENYNCKAWEDSDALSVEEKNPQITQEKEKQRFSLSRVILKGSFLAFNWTEKAFGLSPGWTLLLVYLYSELYCTFPPRYGHMWFINISRLVSMAAF